MTNNNRETPDSPSPEPSSASNEAVKDDRSSPKDERPDPTRYGDWEKNGRCVDF